MPRIGRKQSANNADFVNLIQTISEKVPREYVDRLVDETVAAIKGKVGGRRAAFGWSGGKDSLALQGVCEIAGVRDCVMAITDLEYPEFLRWATDHMPGRLEVVNTGQNLDWLAANPKMLFPQDSATAGKWFKAVQHTGQAKFFRRYNLDILLLGRRRIDGNYVGPAGETIYKSGDGVVRYSPLADWTHEDVIAFNYYHDMPCPPMYRWPNGFVVGSGPWPARQYTGSIENGWREVFSIDPGVVETASTRIASAAEFLRRRAGG